MRKYETLIVANPEIKDETIKEVTEKLAKVVGDCSGKVLSIQDIGVRKLAYRSKKQYKGRFILITFAGNGTAVNEIERNLKLNEQILKYSSIKVAEAATEEEINNAQEKIVIKKGDEFFDEGREKEGRIRGREERIEEREGEEHLEEDLGQEETEEIVEESGDDEGAGAEDKDKEDKPNKRKKNI